MAAPIHGPDALFNQFVDPGRTYPRPGSFPEYRCVCGAALRNPLPLRTEGGYGRRLDSSELTYRCEGGGRWVGWTPAP